MHKKNIRLFSLLIVIAVAAIGSTTLLQSHAASPPSAPSNPWNYTLTAGGGTITQPNVSFCTYFHCTHYFWYNNRGYVELCQDGSYSHQGGQSTSCKGDGGDAQPLYYPAKTTPTPFPSPTMPSIPTLTPTPTATPIPGLPATIPDASSIVPLKSMVVDASWVDPRNGNDVWITGIYSVNRQPCYVQCADYYTAAQFFEHYNGASWSVVPAPMDAANNDNVLYTPSAMSGSGPNDVYTVGQISEGPPQDVAFIEHWDGSVWSVEMPAYPSNIFPYNATFSSVWDLSPTHVYAIGTIYNRDTNHDDILVNKFVGEHWVDIVVGEPATFESLQVQGHTVVLVAQGVGGNTETTVIDTL